MLVRTKHVPRLVKIHWRMLILECSQGCYAVGHRVKFVLRNILVNTRINILQWILTKLSTYWDLKRIWNPIDFQDQRSRSQCIIFRWGDTVTQYKFDPVTLTFDLWPGKSIGFQILLRTKYEPSLVKIQWRMLILYMLSPYEHLEPYWFSKSKVKVTGSNLYCVTSLWTLESTSFNGFWPNLVHT
jgi:hypothetical protein